MLARARRRIGGRFVTQSEQGGRRKQETENDASNTPPASSIFSFLNSGMKSSCEIEFNVIREGEL